MLCCHQPHGSRERQARQQARRCPHLTWLPSFSISPSTAAAACTPCCYRATLRQTAAGRLAATAARRLGAIAAVRGYRIAQWQRRLQLGEAALAAKLLQHLHAVEARQVRIDVLHLHVHGHLRQFDMMLRQISLAVIVSNQMEMHHTTARKKIVTGQRCLRGIVRS